MQSFSLPVDQIKQIVSPVDQIGEHTSAITGVASLDKSTQNDLTFLGNRHYEKMVPGCDAGLILLPVGFDYTPKPNQLAFFVANPSLSFALVCERIEAILRPVIPSGIHPSAVIDREAWVSPDASIGPLCIIEAGATIQKAAVIGAGSYVGHNALIGSHTILKPSVKVLQNCQIGERCILHSGVVIGSDGFGYEFANGEHHKVPQIGKVVVGDDVEIGANTTIDRARFGITTIGAGTKIDNLVQIGHNVTIGKYCLLVAQVGIAGSSTLEDFVVLGGQVGIAGHLTVGAGTQVAAQSGINSSVGAKLVLSGTPAMQMQKNYRIEVLKRKLPELFKRVEKIEENLIK